MAIQFGLLTIEEPVLALAPMAGITNYPFRILAKDEGCELLYSEMVSAKGMHFSPTRNCSLLYFKSAEQPLGIQLFGSEPELIAEAARKVEQLGPAFIDLNLGCPTKKITRNGDGGALMRNPDLCSKIFSALVNAVSCPVTVKLRSGWDDLSKNAVDIAQRAEAAGIKTVTVHGRTVAQGYSGRADWSMVRQVKKALSIPVIGNGDIDSPQSAAEMLSYSGCDGIMIGRAARGNPWIFSQILTYLEKGSLPDPPDPQAVVAMVLKHFKLLIALKGEPAAAREMRRHAAWYIRGLPGAAAARQRLLQSSGLFETTVILNELMASIASQE